MALNATQRSILEGTLRFPFDEIKEFTFEDQTTFQNGIDNERALKALQLILEDDITPSQQAKLTEWNVWDDVEQFRRIDLLRNTTNHLNSAKFLATTKKIS